MISPVRTGSIARATSLATAIRAKVPMMALLGGPPQPDRVQAAILELGSSQTGFVRISNPLGVPLSLEQLVWQIAGEKADDDPRDHGERVLRALIDRSDMRRQLVVVVEQAETLTPEALEFLHGLPGLSHPSLALVQVALVGAATLGARIADNRIYIIDAWAGFAPPPAVRSPTLAPQASPPTLAPQAGSPGVVKTGRPRVEVFWLAGLGLCGVVAVLFMVGLFQPDTIPQAPTTTRLLPSMAAQVPSPPMAGEPEPSAPASQQASASAPPTPPAVQQLTTPPPAPPMAAAPEPSVPASQQALASASAIPPAGQQLTTRPPDVTGASPQASSAELPIPEPPLPPVAPLVEDVATARARLYGEFTAFVGSRGLGRRMSQTERAALFEEYLARHQTASSTVPASGLSSGPSSGPTSGATPGPVLGPAEGETSRIAGEPHVLVLFAAGSEPDREAAEQQAELLQARVAGIELQAEAEVPTQPTIRYEFAADRIAALALAQTVPPQGGDWQVEDMTASPTRTEPGTIELWLPRR